MKVLIAAGGTAGHIIPALAVAEELLKEDKNTDILFLTSRKKQDLEFIKSKNFRVLRIFAGKARRYFSFYNFTDIFLIIFGFFQSFFIILKFKPQVIFSKGGYISLPVVFAGRVLGKRVIAHESDLVLGLANKVCLPFIYKLAVSFPLEVYKDINSKKLIFSGNPTRKLISENKTGNANTLLVIGGSQGARNINYAVYELLDDLLEKFKVIHLVGESDYSHFKEKKGSLEKDKALNYILLTTVFDEKEFNNLINESFVVVSRAGAGAISEFSLLAKPTIFVPLLGHQEENAEYLSKKGAAVIIKDKDLTPDILKEKIQLLFSDNNLRNNLIKNISKFSCPNASSILAKEIIKAQKSA